MKLTKLFPLLLLLVLPVKGLAQTKQTIFKNASGSRYRIPAITKLKNGRMAYFGDLRYGTGDIGLGAAIDIVMRKTSRSGRPGEVSTVAKGHDDYGYGDAAVVCDQETGELLVMAAAGRVVFFKSKPENPMRVARLHSSDGGKTWTNNDVTRQIYTDCFHSLYDGMFFTSGRICQSRLIKAGRYYRLYSAVCVRSLREGKFVHGSVVVYSDDFGRTWKPLGQYDELAVPNGDEAKIEELPNGNVVISSRTKGRWFNIFTYSNATRAEGSWGEPALSPDMTTASACNGELLIVPAKRLTDGRSVSIALQSLAFGKRENVSLLWKELATPADYATPEAMGRGWTRMQASQTTSAYSTMAQDRKGRIVFYYEENLADHGYDLQSVTYTLEQITQGKYASK